MELSALKTLCENNLKDLDEIKELIRKYKKAQAVLKKYSGSGLSALVWSFSGEVKRLEKEIDERVSDNRWQNRQIEYELMGLSISDRLEMADYFLDQFDAFTSGLPLEK